MSHFAPDLEDARSREYDLIVIGSGIYGMTIALEAARRGLKPLVIDKADFGGATSLNSLRILHGGLRYLQSMDLPRFFESVQQRSWFLENFGPLCRPLPCLLPLYGKGLKRRSVFRIALGINDLLAGNTGLPKGKLLNKEEVQARFPLVPQEKLQGGALWYDGQMLSPQRIHAELLRWIASLGGHALNYVEAQSLDTNGGKVSGVNTSKGRFKAPIVINAAGPWCDDVAARLGEESAKMMTPMLTYNVLLSSAPLSDAALAIQGSRLFFITPHKRGATFLGTMHHAWDGHTRPTTEMVESLFQELRDTVPGWEVSKEDLLEVTPGIVPCLKPGVPEMAHRPVVREHSIAGLYSVCGIKYTTAQRLAERLIRRIFGKLQAIQSKPNLADRRNLHDPQAFIQMDDADLYNFMREEAVTTADDMTTRRMDWIFDPLQRRSFAERVESLLNERTPLP